MNKSVVSTLICRIYLTALVLFVQGEVSATVGNVQRQRVSIAQPTKLTGQKTVLEAEKRVMEAGKSGLKGTTSFVVKSGIPGGQTTGGPRSMEFAIAPIEGDKPAYDKVIFIKSDEKGNYEVALPPGKYWIGSKAKAQNPANHRPGATLLSEEVAVVKEGGFTRIDLVEVGYAP